MLLDLGGGVLEEPRSWSSLMPTISRQPSRSGPHATPSRRTGSGAVPPGRRSGSRLGPAVQGGGVQRHPLPVVPAHQVGDHRARVTAGSPALDVRCTKVADAHPEVPARTRTPSGCRCVTAACFSAKTPELPPTASTWAIETTAAVSGPANAHNKETLFGAEKVASMAGPWAGWDRPVPRRSPDVGGRSTPAAWSGSTSTPTRPSWPANCPDYTPGTSPAPR